MTAYAIPHWTLSHAAEVPTDRPVVLLLRHSVRGPLPTDGLGHLVPLTDEGVRVARVLGAQLRGRLAALRTSPIPRCVQTAEAMGEGAGLDAVVAVDPVLGPTAPFFADPPTAFATYQALGQEETFLRLSDPHADPHVTIPGFAPRKDAAARMLRHLLEPTETSARAGIHASITHDIFVLAMVAALAHEAIPREDWPQFLDGAFLWPSDGQVRLLYRGRRIELKG